LLLRRTCAAFVTGISPAATAGLRVFVVVVALASSAVCGAAGSGVCLTGGSRRDPHSPPAAAFSSFRQQQAAVTAAQAGVRRAKKERKEQSIIPAKHRIIDLISTHPSIDRQVSARQNPRTAPHAARQPCTCRSSITGLCHEQDSAGGGTWACAVCAQARASVCVCVCAARVRACARTAECMAYILACAFVPSVRSGRGVHPAGTDFQFRCAS
jgi:hypothetical protein